MWEIVGDGQTFGDFEGGAGDDGVGGVGAAGPALAAVACQWLMGLSFMRDLNGVVDHTRYSGRGQSCLRCRCTLW
jgi:hypothetical protein